jgi:hypothetical protein
VLAAAEKLGQAVRAAALSRSGYPSKVIGVRNDHFW